MRDSLTSRRGGKNPRRSPPACGRSVPARILILMGTHMDRDPDDSEDLLRRAAAGDEAALAAPWQRHRGRLRQMVRLRLDRRLQGRVDPSDVLREAYLDLAARLPDYARDRPMPTYLWLRLVTGQRLMPIHRQHLGAAMRDAGRRSRSTA